MSLRRCCAKNYLGSRRFCSAANASWKFITEPTELSDVTARVKAAARVGVDTEFTDFPKLHPELNLVQLVIDGDEFIVDPQACPASAASVSSPASFLIHGNIAT